jgi:hypothetical protein
LLLVLLLIHLLPVLQAAWQELHARRLLLLPLLLLLLPLLQCAGAATCRVEFGRCPNVSASPVQVGT